jgi:hypothetical protein
MEDSLDWIFSQLAELPWWAGVLIAGVIFGWLIGWFEDRAFERKYGKKPRMIDSSPWSGLVFFTLAIWWLVDKINDGWQSIDTMLGVICGGFMMIALLANANGTEWLNEIGLELIPLDEEE